jgi:hypothetical protein
MSRNQKIAPLVAMMIALSCCGGVASAGEQPRSAYGQLDRPPAREAPTLTADEVSKLKKDLAGARDRQNSHLKAKEGAPAAQPKKP